METKGSGAGGGDGDALPRGQHNQFQVTFHINGGESADCPTECRDVSAAFTLPPLPPNAHPRTKKKNQACFYFPLENNVYFDFCFFIFIFWFSLPVANRRPL